MKNARLKIVKSHFKIFSGKYGIGFLITNLVLATMPFPQFVFGQSVTSEIEQVLKVTSKPVEKGLIMCTREIHLKPHVDPKAFEKWIIEYWNPEWQDLIPGFQSYVDKKESDAGEYAYIYFLQFNTKKAIKTSVDNDDEYADWYRELIYYEPTKHLYDESFEYIEADLFFNKRACFENLKVER
ncbi:hypothetical protein BH23BAC1_BH23BAC1_04250 [soil metagenome]